MRLGVGFLLLSPTENEGISSLEANDVAVFVGGLYDELVDLLLLLVVTTRPLPDEDGLAVSGRFGQ